MTPDPQSPRLTLDAPALPTGRIAWAIYALVGTILALSSAAPFLRFGEAGPRLRVEDLFAVLLYVLLWIPLVGLLLGYVRATRSRPVAAWTWLGHGALLLTVPTLHTITFLLAQVAFAGEAIHPSLFAGDVRLPVLTLLATLQYLVLVAIIYAVLAGRISDQTRLHAAELELIQARLESQLSRARVDALRTQLHPHFLFNTLNSISVLTGSDPPRARVMVHRLSELLRAVVADGDQATIPLRRELEVLDAYLGIQRVRFGERLQVTVTLDPAAADWSVPALVLQPLVENAIQHAIADREAGGSIEISARISGSRLSLLIADDGPGCDPSSGATGGLGLRNTRERLQQLYGAEHHFELRSPPRGGCMVELELPGEPAGIGVVR